MYRKAHCRDQVFSIVRTRHSPSAKLLAGEYSPARLSRAPTHVRGHPRDAEKGSTSRPDYLPAPPRPCQLVLIDRIERPKSGSTPQLWTLRLGLHQLIDRIEHLKSGSTPQLWTLRHGLCQPMLDLTILVYMCSFELRARFANGSPSTVRSISRSMFWNVSTHIFISR